MTSATPRRARRAPGPLRSPGRRSERAMVAGVDGLAFATMVLLAGSLAVLNIWSFIDTRAALDAAGRDYLRAYTQAADPLTALLDGEAAATDVLRARGTPLRSLHIDPPDAATFGPCQPAEVALRAEVPAMRVPFLDDLAGRTVSVRQHELVDAHREITTGPRHDPEATPCAE